MPEESMREAFEQAVREKFHVCMVDFARAGDGYQNPVNDYMWWAWQEASNPLLKALQAITTQVEGNIRPTVRDCVNGQNNVQDIYGYCDQIESIAAAAMKEPQP